VGPAGLRQDHDRRLQRVGADVLVVDLERGVPPDVREFRTPVELRLHGERPRLHEGAERGREAPQRLGPDVGLREPELAARRRGGEDVTLGLEDGLRHVSVPSAVYLQFSI